MTHNTEADRADFEAWAVAEVFPISRCFDDDSLYEYTVTQRKWEDWQAARRAPAAPSTWKDHDTAKLVNDLRDCAVQYHAAGQLRERIAHLVRPLAARLACAQAAPVPQEPTSKQVVLGAGALLGQPENTADNRHPDWHSAVAKARSVYLAMLAAAPQPPEAGCSVSNGETQAAPVQLPEPAIPGSQGVCCGNFTTGGYYMGQHEQVCCGCPDDAHPPYYTEHQVRELLASHGIGKDKA